MGSYQGLVGFFFANVDHSSHILCKNITTCLTSLDVGHVVRNVNSNTKVTRTGARDVVTQRLITFSYIVY